MEMITLCRNYVAHATVQIRSEYRVPKSEYFELIGEGYTNEQALEELRSTNMASHLGSTHDTNEVLCVHSEEVDVVDH
mgnify:CR=1 FL=1